MNYVILIPIYNDRESLKLLINHINSEIKDFDAAAEWVGMPDYEPSTLPKKIIVSFKNDQDREAFGKILNILKENNCKKKPGFQGQYLLFKKENNIAGQNSIFHFFFGTEKHYDEFLINNYTIASINIFSIVIN